MPEFLKLYRLAYALGLFLAVTSTPADELKVADVMNAKGDGPDGKGNTDDDTWGFWFELAHARGQFSRLSLHTTTMSPAQRKDGIKKKVRGPIASMLPSPADSEGWIFHRDWDGRFEGVWGDRKAGAVLVYPYVEKNSHCAVAVTYRVRKKGNYEISGKLTDLTVNTAAPHDGILWRIEHLTGKDSVRVLDKGGPVGDGKGPESAAFRVANAVLAERDLVRLVIHPNKWWGTDLTRVDDFKIEPVAAAPKAETSGSAAAEEQPVSLIQDGDIARLEKQRAPRPSELALVFSNGYAGDSMPKEDERFEQLLKLIKEGGFNVIHCTYTDKRLELCKRHGLKMMIDLLAPEHHVYKSPEKAQAVCEKLRNNPDVWGYNIWNDTFAKTGEVRRRDVNTVRKWDPTHPAYSGTYRTIGMRHLVNADVMGYYDFHWKRGPNLHFPHLLAFWNWARERDAVFYAWLWANSGIPGKGNFNRNLYSANTSIACGLRGYIWFIGADLMNPKTLAWTETGRDLIKVNHEILPLRQELAQVGVPTAIYSTPISRTLNNDPIDKKDAMPPGLEKHGFPRDFWLQPAGGEFLMGVSTDTQKRDVVFLANHNAYAEQKVVLKLSKESPVRHFDRKTGAWRTLDVQNGAIAITLAAGSGELLRFGK